MNYNNSFIRKVLTPMMNKAQYLILMIFTPKKDDAHLSVFSKFLRRFESVIIDKMILGFGEACKSGV